MIALIFGPPGSGKGTQAALLRERRGLLHVSTGDVLRAEAAAGSPLGREVGEVMARGDLVSDDLMIRVVETRLQQPDAREGSVLFDGFPRTLPQAEAFDAMLGRRGLGLDLVICLDVPEDVLRSRVLHRASQEARPDDTVETLERRLLEYNDKTVPAIEHYRELPAFRSVDGDRPPEAVAADIAVLFDQAVRTAPA